jgi:hypothetical protein
MNDIHHIVREKERKDINKPKGGTQGKKEGIQVVETGSKIHSEGGRDKASTSSP